MASESNAQTAFNCFNTRTFRESMRIPDILWKAMEPELRDKIWELKKKIIKQKNDSNLNPPSHPVSPHTPSAAHPPRVPPQTNTVSQVPDQ